MKASNFIHDFALETHLPGQICPGEQGISHLTIRPQKLPSSGLRMYSSKARLSSSQPATVFYVSGFFSAKNLQFRCRCSSHPTWKNVAGFVTDSFVTASFGNRGERKPWFKTTSKLGEWRSLPWVEVKRATEPKHPKNYLNCHLPSTHPTLSTSTFQHHFIDPRKTSRTKAPPPFSCCCSNSLPQPNSMWEMSSRCSLLSRLASASASWALSFNSCAKDKSLKTLPSRWRSNLPVGKDGVDVWGDTKQNTVKLLGNLNLKSFKTKILMMEVLKR